MKRALVKASKSTSQAGRVKTVTIRVASGTSSVTGKASVKTK